MILTLDTSTKALSISLFQEVELAHIELRHKLAHSQQIVSICDFLLKRLSFSLKSLSAAYAGIGPGSFTGIRIGLSFVNTLSQVLRIPLLGVSSLDLLAFENGRWYNSVVSFIRSRKHEVYTAYYRQGSRESDYIALEKNDFIAFLKDCSPKNIVAPEDDFQDLEEIKELDIEISFSFPSSRSLYYISRECGMNPGKQYLKPIYIRSI
jgi:tRNA threonylcarbamoyladenosine biosynthesis protein TsaB